MLHINQYIQNAINSIENDKQKAINLIKDKVQREVINAHNVEVDQYKNKALNELQQKYEKDRADIIAQSENNKTTFAKNEIETAIAVEIAKYDEKINQLKALLVKE